VSPNFRPASMSPNFLPVDATDGRERIRKKAHRAYLDG
jgi:hypothetical protein